VSNGQLVDSRSNPLRLVGVDIAHLENSCIKNQGFSTGAIGNNNEDNSTDTATVVALQSWHVNAVRLPLNEDCWLGINGVPTTYAGANYQMAISNFVTDLNAKGIYVILDLHYAAPGSYPANQQWPMADADHSVTFWQQVAAAYKSNPAVMFDLFNEPTLGRAAPTTSDWSCWLHGCTTTFTGTINGAADASASYSTAGMQQMVDAVRATGADQPIMVGGLHWAGDPCGIMNSGGNDGVCTQTADMPTDPANQLAISLHVYGPTHNTACAKASCWATVAAAAKTAKLPIVTGELGEQDCTDDSWLNSYMSWADQNNVSYLAWGWDVVPQAAACSNFTSAQSPGTGNLELLSNWGGSPSRLGLQAQDYHTHLAGLGL
jgi:aryl-phospho-beta-D-glucosidase BglC (GH1 family)